MFPWQFSPSYDEVIVGAPLFSTPTQIEKGRIFIFKLNVSAKHVYNSSLGQKWCWVIPDFVCWEGGRERDTAVSINWCVGVSTSRGYIYCPKCSKGELELATNYCTYSLHTGYRFIGR